MDLVYVEARPWEASYVAPMVPDNVKRNGPRLSPKLGPDW